MDELTIVLPLPPIGLSKNGRGDWHARHRLFKRAKSEARLLFVDAINRSKIGEPTPWISPVEYRVRWFAGRKPLPDDDNIMGRIGAALDAGQGLLYANDSQLRIRGIERDVDRAEPRCEITFRRIDG